MSVKVKLQIGFEPGQIIHATIKTEGGKGEKGERQVIVHENMNETIDLELEEGQKLSVEAEPKEEFVFDRDSLAVTRKEIKKEEGEKKEPRPTPQAAAAQARHTTTERHTSASSR